MSYRQIFRPREVDVDRDADTAPADKEVYVFDDARVVLAVNAAIVSGRPLLVLGPPGSGKSTLALNVARVLGCELIRHVVTSETTGRDFLWTVDAVRRLADAQARHLDDDEAYQVRGALWQAFAVMTATAPEPLNGAVVLIDEIDKATPDVPDALLVPLGSLAFRGPGGNTIRPAGGRRPLVVLTSNDEQPLSAPFVRRCIVIRLQPATVEHLVRVGEARFGFTEERRRLCREVAGLLPQLHGRSVSTAEYLDVLRCCIELEITPHDDEWRILLEVAAIKERDRVAG